MSLIRKSFCTLLSITLISQSFYSCSKSRDNNISNDETAEIKDNLDGKDIYRGLTFGYGKIADETDIIRNNYNIKNRNFNSNQNKEYINQSEKLIKFISENDASYFDELKKAVENSDVVEVDRIIFKSRNLVDTYIKEKNKNNNDENINNERVGNCGVAGLVCVAYAAVAVHNAAAITTYAAVALAQWKWVGVNNTNENHLLYQQTLLEIINKYGNK